MKKLVSLMLVVLAVVAITSCKKSEGPEAVAEKFLQHLNKKEYAEAKVLGTEATGQFLDMMKSLAEMGGQPEESKEVKIENLKAEVDGDSAVVSYTIDGKDEKLPMVKQDGKWLVNMSKEDQMGEGEGEGELEGEVEGDETSDVTEGTPVTE